MSQLSIYLGGGAVGGAAACFGVSMRGALSAPGELAVCAGVGAATAYGLAMVGLVPRINTGMPEIDAFLSGLPSGAAGAWVAGMAMRAM